MKEARQAAKRAMKFLMSCMGDCEDGVVGVIYRLRCWIALDADEILESSIRGMGTEICWGIKLSASHHRLVRLSEVSWHT